MACDDETLHSQSRIASITEEVDLQVACKTAWHLQYVNCTNACDQLMMSAVDPASDF